MILEENENKDFTVREIQTKDTLLSIATSVGMSGEQLMDFHNMHCEKVGLMWLNSLVGRDKILIPKNYKSPAQISSERKDALPKPVFSQNFYADSYQVQETFDNDLIIAYQVELKPDKEKNILKLSKNNFKKNNISAEDKISDIALACAQSIEPVILRFNIEGLPEEITNHKVLVEDFVSQRSELEEFYAGETYTAYLNKFQESISDEKKLLEKLKATLIYQILFPKRSWFEKNTDWKDEFFVLQGCFAVQCDFSVEYNLDSQIYAETTIRAEMTDLYTLPELFKGRKNEEEQKEDDDDDDTKISAQVELKITYKTDKSTKMMYQASAEILFLQEGVVYKEHKLLISQI